jgi:hypothetical protein
MKEETLQRERLDEALELTVEELPLEVVPDWAEQVRVAAETCDLIDRHLDYEARCRGLWEITEFRPRHLCPQQRIDMITDLYATTR